jgi:BolA family transcriptional regulator, general stress-responsive regulator
MIEAQLYACLQAAFSPSHLEVINESHGHAVAPGSQTHFKVVLVSDALEGKTPVARHRAVYAALGDLFRQGLHALALHTYTPAEWQAQGAAPDSPACLGGSKFGGS